MIKESWWVSLAKVTLDGGERIWVRVDDAPDTYEAIQIALRETQNPETYSQRFAYRRCVVCGETDVSCRCIKRMP